MSKLISQNPKADKSNNNECLPEDQWPIGKKAAFYSGFIVFFLAMFDFIDRQVLAAILPYVKAEWALTDTQLGLLIAAVNIAMAGFVIPSAYFIDKWSRKKMIVIMGTVWSLATAACGFANNYTQMLIARTFIGCGEAGYSPASQALFSAQFPTKYRATAIAITQVGLAMGAPLGLIIGGYIASHYGWRTVFGVVAIPGLILAFLALFIKDYKSIEVTQKTDISTSEKTKELSLSYPAVIAKIVKTPSLLCVFAGAVMAMLFNGAQMNWMPSYLAREAGMPIADASNLAALTLFASIVSTLLAGPTLDWLRKNTKVGAPAYVACALALSAVLFYIAYGMLTPGSGLQITIIALALFCFGISTASGPVISMDLSHPGARATTAGILIFCQNLFGFALGPLVTGFLSDSFGLAKALLIVAVSAPGLVAISYGLCVLFYRKDLDNVECVDLEFETK